MARIVKGPPDHPRAEDTCLRLTNEWWDMCSECWNSEPSLRPAMVGVTKKIEMIVRLSLVVRLPVTDPSLKMASSRSHVNGSANLM